MNMCYPSDLTAGEWDALQPYLPAVPRHGRPRTHPLRTILNAVFYLLRTGCPWRYSPRTFPPAHPQITTSAFEPVFGGHYNLSKPQFGICEDGARAGISQCGSRWSDGFLGRWQ